MAKQGDIFGIAGTCISEVLVGLIHGFISRFVSKTEEQEKGNSRDGNTNSK
jgi:hypothetical protein